MPVNLDKPLRWKEDIATSVDMYNKWFMDFAPAAFRETRIKATKDVEATLDLTKNLTDIRPETIKENPDILPTLRMSTCPPIAVDRLIGLANVSANLVRRMEKEKKLPVKMKSKDLDKNLEKISKIIEKMSDPDIFVWKNRDDPATKTETHRAATIVADRLCGSVANPIIRNAQEKRQLAAIAKWLKSKGYNPLPNSFDGHFQDMPSGTYSFRMNVPVGKERAVNMPIDAIIKPLHSSNSDFPILIEAKSAGDFTNTNKRRKEEAQKVNQLREKYGQKIQFILFLCGYFDSGYLGYEASEGIDWIWEHRIDDLGEFGL